MILHRMSRRRGIAATGVGLLITAGLILVLAGSGGHATHPAQTQTNHAAATVPASAAPATSSASAPTAATPMPRLAALPPTQSADVYAGEVAEALWNVDYRTVTRDQIVALWQHELADTLPAGLPARTTLTQTQAAAMSTLNTYLPSAAMWPNLARDHTVSSFKVTAISEPASWVSAVIAGQIIDPGLTARTVIGVQTITYGAGLSRRSSTQSQQLTIAMLCPPTTPACRVEIIPPTASAGSTG